MSWLPLPLLCVPDVFSSLQLQSAVALRQLDKKTQILIDTAGLAAILSSTAHWTSCLVSINDFTKKTSVAHTARSLLAWARSGALGLDDFVKSGSTHERNVVFKASRRPHLDGALAMGLTKSVMRSVKFLDPNLTPDKTAHILSRMVINDCNAKLYSKCERCDTPRFRDYDSGLTQSTFTLNVSFGRLRVHLLAYADFRSVEDETQQEQEITCSCSFVGGVPEHVGFKVTLTSQTENIHVPSYALLDRMCAEILGENVQSCVALNFLWRLLCATTIVWPREGTKEWHGSLCKDVRGTSPRLFGGDWYPCRPPERRHEDLPPFLGFKTVFGLVADHINRARGDEPNAKHFDEMSSSPFDNIDRLDNISSGVAGPAPPNLKYFFASMKDLLGPFPSLASDSSDTAAEETEVE